MEQFEEVPSEVRFEMNHLDWHCFHSPDGVGLTIAQHMRLGGFNVQPSTKEKIQERSQNLRHLLRMDDKRKHIVTGQWGAPRLYISTAPELDYLRWELKRCIVKTRKTSKNSYNEYEVRQDKDDHGIDTMEYGGSALGKRVAFSKNKWRIHYQH